ncbi:hypothetical protein [Sinanaerobacter sp. ZZT-01]|uniref:hypothetical protein n=1 Tax=Sinanaerobacter sp. ZZT-01 TaxID=3111540 RepID=UPI002D7766A9|nr:hypothetical protein [Sinanaerobacter sp. ZZT-01]WRR92718.1 hypothetical protein U5921_11775 [Sinanaerobacter sp. ZZT-01]
MRLTERMSTEGYLKNIRKDFKKGTVLQNILENSDFTTVEEAKQANPEFVKAAVDYIKYAERLTQQGYTPAQTGKVTDSSEERKALQKAFTLDTTDKVKMFYPEWYLTAHELFIYHLLEAVFDASLLVEQGAARRFEETATLYKSFYTVKEIEGWTFAYYDRTILFIDLNKGRISTASNRAVRDKIGDSGIKGFKRTTEQGKVVYSVVLEDGQVISLMKDQKLSTSIWSQCHTLKDSKKEYYQICLKPRVSDEEPMVQFPAHMILLLAQFGINTVKHMLSKDGLTTCDHVDMTGNRNTLSNLEITTRKDNKLRACSKDPITKQIVSSYNLADFWQHIEQSFNLNKIDVKIKRENMLDYWGQVLKEQTVEEILKVS